MDFDEFAIKIYTESIYKTLISATEAKNVKVFSKKNYQDTKEIKCQLAELSAKIAKEFVRILKSKGFPNQEISPKDQKLILKGIINDYIQVEAKE